MLPLLPLLLAPQDVPVVVVDRDNVRIEASCIVVVEAEHLTDYDGNGVVRIAGSDIEVDFAGAHLRGAAPGVQPDAYNGIGIQITGENVQLRNARVSGFKGGIRATGANGLQLDDCDVSDNFRRHLKSTPQAEDASDWLWPHANDNDEWLLSYGAGIYVEDCANVFVRRCRARNGQNGLLLDRVEDSDVIDNDFSFLSGWGIALWRSSRNSIVSNACDFCIRGYSHGVYNRGQDSAGILMFEQCNENVVAHNSATHCGDGFFGFGGKEALGENAPPSPDFDHHRRGNNDNLLFANDFSYAAAHGIEMTFSFGNRFLGNRLVENAICGVWGGYSRDTVIAGNTIERNGDMGYGLERGGINIEHGQRILVQENEFRGNECGVHFWWDRDAHFEDLPWMKANGMECEDNTVVGNRFTGDAVAVHLRDCGRTLLGHNDMDGVGKELEKTEGVEVVEEAGAPKAIDEPETDFGETLPFGARRHLEGRDKILMTEWGPYDWESPYLRLEPDPDSGDHLWRLLGSAAIESFEARGGVKATLADGVVRVAPEKPGTIARYTLEVTTGDGTLTGSALLMALDWEIRFFAYEHDPMQREDAWRGDAKQGVVIHAPTLDLAFAGGGPSDLPGIADAVREAALPADRFGTIATAKVRIPAGRWRLTTTSDDGIRVWFGNDLVIDDWTHHAPRRNDAELRVPQARTATIRVEHFELGGHAVLTVGIEPAE